MDKQIFVVEDHPLVRRGLISLIEAEPDLAVCGETESAQVARQRISEICPDLAIVDLFLEEGNGLTLIEDLQSETKVPTLVISAQDETLYAHRVLAAGAHGYLMKTEAYWKVVEAIRHVLNGDIYLSEKMSSALLASFAGRPTTPANSLSASLSNRELEVFTLMGTGLGRQAIAETLSLSPKTIDTYRDHLKKKLSLASTDELRQHAAVWVATGEQEL